MSHPLHASVQDRLCDAIAADYYLTQPQVQSLATTAIEVIFDDLIACSEFRQQANERRGDTAGAEHWAMERAWLVNRKEEVLS